MRRFGGSHGESNHPIGNTDVGSSPGLRNPRYRWQACDPVKQNFHLLNVEQKLKHPCPAKCQVRKCFAAPWVQSVVADPDKAGTEESSVRTQSKLGMPFTSVPKPLAIWASLLHTVMIALYSVHSIAITRRSDHQLLEMVLSTCGRHVTHAALACPDS